MDDADADADAIGLDTTPDPDSEKMEKENARMRVRAYADPEAKEMVHEWDGKTFFYRRACLATAIPKVTGMDAPGTMAA